MTDKHSDRELLELAAKAEGLSAFWDDEHELMQMAYGSAEFVEEWNPLTDDGDALRLAVALRLDVSIWDSGATVTYEKVGAFDIATIHEHGEPLAATRRAIVRAAAEMGESK